MLRNRRTEQNLSHGSDGTTFKVLVMNTFWTRLKGLLGSSGLEEGHGLLISPCHSIHTIGMKYPIDVIFLDKNYSVLKVVKRLAPYRAASYSGAAKTLELPAGSADLYSIKTCDRFQIEGAM